MIPLTVVLPLLLGAPEPCWLVTCDGIQRIPCHLDAAEVDALRYAAEDTPEARERRQRQWTPRAHAAQIPSRERWSGRPARERR